MARTKQIRRRGPGVPVHGRIIKTSPAPRKIAASLTKTARAAVTDMPVQPVTENDPDGAISMVRTWHIVLAHVHACKLQQEEKAARERLDLESAARWSSPGWLRFSSHSPDGWIGRLPGQLQQGIVAFLHPHELARLALTRASWAEKSLARAIESEMWRTAENEALAAADLVWERSQSDPHAGKHARLQMCQAIDGLLDCIGECNDRYRGKDRRCKVVEGLLRVRWQLFSIALWRPGRALENIRKDWRARCWEWSEEAMGRPKKLCHQDDIALHSDLSTCGTLLELVRHVLRARFEQLVIATTLRALKTTCKGLLPTTAFVFAKALLSMGSRDGKRWCRWLWRATSSAWHAALRESDASFIRACLRRLRRQASCVSSHLVF